MLFGDPATLGTCGEAGTIVLVSRHFGRVMISVGGDEATYASFDVAEPWSLLDVDPQVAPASTTPDPAERFGVASPLNGAV
jgi:hypothetical protein